MRRASFCANWLLALEAAALATWAVLGIGGVQVGTVALAHMLDAAPDLGAALVCCDVDHFDKHWVPNRQDVSNLLHLDIIRVLPRKAQVVADLAEVDQPILPIAIQLHKHAKRPHLLHRCPVDGVQLRRLVAVPPAATVGTAAAAGAAAARHCQRIVWIQVPPILLAHRSHAGRQLDALRAGALLPHLQNLHPHLLAAGQEELHGLDLHLVVLLPPKLDLIRHLGVVYQRLLAVAGQLHKGAKGAHRHDTGVVDGAHLGGHV